MRAVRRTRLRLRDHDCAGPRAVGTPHLVSGGQRRRAEDAERDALRAQIRTVRVALDALLTYYEGHLASFPTLKKPVRKAKKAVTRLTRSAPSVTGPRRKSLAKLAALRGRIP